MDSHVHEALAALIQLELSLAVTLLIDIAG